MVLKNFVAFGSLRKEALALTQGIVVRVRIHLPRCAPEGVYLK